MAYRTIMLKGEGVRYEALAYGATITPGYLLQLGGSAVDHVRVHATAGGDCERAFAVEDDLQGGEIGDIYAAESTVQYNICAPGDVVYAILATNQTVTKGDRLASNGNGQLQKYVPASGSVTEKAESIVGYAIESVTTTSAVARIQVRIV